MKKFVLGFFDKSVVTKSISRQYILFFIIGMFCFVIDISTMWFFKNIAGKNIYLSVGIAFIVATYVNYLLSVKIVFNDGKHNKAKEITYFFIAASIAFFFTIGAMLIFVEVFALNYIVAKVITVFLVSIFSFTIRKIIIFKN